MEWVKGEPWGHEVHVAFVNGWLTIELVDHRDAPMMLTDPSSVPGWKCVIDAMADDGRSVSLLPSDVLLAEPDLETAKREAVAMARDILQATIDDLGR